MARQPELPRSSERSMEARHRRPLELKGLRTRFRTRLRDVGLLPRPGLRLRTDIERRGGPGPGPVLLVIVTQGLEEDFQRLASTLEGQTFESLPIRVIRRSK